jgi:beta-N-acetylhexosaminidase
MSTGAALAGRHVMVDIAGTRLAPEEAEFLSTQRVRAVCLFRKNITDEAQVRRLTAALREAMGKDCLIAVDQEGGSVIRATFLPQAPSAMALGATGDEALAESVGAAVARGIGGLGINWNFAPVLDVNNNPANPVIAERSFGEDPSSVARLAGAWMRGSLRQGVACCVKHFPGHGDTHVDSHRDLPVVDKSLAQLEALELLPFRALHLQAPAMMTAHIVYPQVDPEHPATLSRTFLTGLLRQSMGYEGVVITDSLVMKAIHDRYGHDRAAVLALQSGADMVMALGARSEQHAALRAVARAIDAGALALDPICRSAERLDALARRFPVRPSPTDAARRALDETLMRRAWEAGLTGLGNPLPPRRDRPLRVVTQGAVPSDGVSEAGPSSRDVAALFDGFPSVEWVVVEDLARMSWSSLPSDGRDTVLVSNIHDRYLGAPVDRRPTLHLAIWNPYHALDAAAPAVLTWGYAPPALAALAAWLRGEATLQGRMPVDLTMQESRHV